MADVTDPAWQIEREWLHGMLRRGLPVRDATEHRRVRAALARATSEVGDSIEQAAMHEAAHAVVAHALGWNVAFVGPVGCDGNGVTGMRWPAELPATRENMDRAHVGWVMSGVAGYVAERVWFGRCLPEEACEIAVAIRMLLSVDADFAEQCLLEAEQQTEVLLSMNSEPVKRLAEALVENGRVEGQALAAILAGVVAG